MIIHRKLMQTITTGSIVLSLSLVVALPVIAAQPKPLPKPTSLLAIKSDLAQEKSSITSLSNNQKELKKDISKLTNKLMSTSKDIRKHEKNLKNAQDQLKSLETQKQELQASLQQGQKDLTALLSSYQRIRRTPKSALLSDKIDPIDIARSEAIFAHTLPYIKSQITLASDNLQKIQNLEEDISKTVKTKNKHIRKLSKAETELSKIITKKNKAHVQTSAQITSRQKHIKELAAQANNLEELIFKVTPPKPTRKTAQKPSRSGPNLKLRKTLTHHKSLLPVVGKISTKFGSKDPLGARSQGITLNTREGANVYTPIAGTVQFSGPFQKFKNLLIIEHDNQYHSLIAGFDVVNTRVGTKLSAGEIIGKFASSTSSPKLYYELRRNGKPINPETILNAQN